MLAVLALASLDLLPDPLGTVPNTHVTKCERKQTWRDSWLYDLNWVKLPDWLYSRASPTGARHFGLLVVFQQSDDLNANADRQMVAAASEPIGLASKKTFRPPSAVFENSRNIDKLPQEDRLKYVFCRDTKTVGTAVGGAYQPSHLPPRRLPRNNQKVQRQPKNAAAND